MGRVRHVGPCPGSTCPNLPQRPRFVPCGALQIAGITRIDHSFECTKTTFVADSDTERSERAPSGEERLGISRHPAPEGTRALGRGGRSPRLVRSTEAIVIGPGARRVRPSPPAGAIQYGGHAPRDGEPEQVVVHGPVSGVSRDIARRADGETLLPGDRRQVGRELGPFEQGGEPNDHHAGDVMGLLPVMEALASASDDGADPGPNQPELGVEIRPVVRTRSRTASPGRETRRVTFFAHSGTASRTASARAAGTSASEIASVGKPVSSSTSWMNRARSNRSVDPAVAPPRAAAQPRGPRRSSRIGRRTRAGPARDPAGPGATATSPARPSGDGDDLDEAAILVRQSRRDPRVQRRQQGPGTRREVHEVEVRDLTVSDEPADIDGRSGQ